MAVAPLPHAGVRFPPPLVYVVGLAIGWLLHRRWPLTLAGGASGVREILAAIFITAWLALMLGAFATFRRAGTAIIPNRPATAFVTSGPYRLTRNPMYLSLAFVYLGVTLLINSWWPLVFLPVVLLVIQRAVIAREERYLTDAFPIEYPAYCRRVRRWL